MKKSLLLVLLVISLIFISGCVPPKQKAISLSEESTNFIVANPLNVSQIQRMSTFRSCIGHDYSGLNTDGEKETLRSMKHYLEPLPSLIGTNQIKIFAPFDGKVVEILDGPPGKGIYISAKAAPSWKFIFFHVIPAAGIEEGALVQAGEQLGTVSEDIRSNFDFALKQFGWKGQVFDSPFVHMKETIFKEYGQNGITLKNIIVSKQTRDADPCPVQGTRNGDALFPGYREEDFVALHTPKKTSQEPDQQVEGKTTPPSQGLGRLCSGEEQCISFCQNNPGQCEGYCQRNTENPICQKIYSFDGVDKKLRKKIEIPDEKPVLSLPFNESDDLEGLLPMGETISHNGEPHGGIDFFWNNEAKILAAVDGEIVYIDRRKLGEVHEGMWDIFVRTGEYYVTGYTELGIVNPGAYLGKTVRKGEWLGNPNNANIRNWMIHWEFGYYPDGWQGYGGPQPKPHPDRLCPMSYFDENSKQRIEEIWDNAPWEHRKEFPYICSGIFEGKDE